MLAVLWNVALGVALVAVLAVSRSQAQEPLFTSQVGRKLDVAPRSTATVPEVDACMGACLAQSGYACLSFDYNLITRSCELNDQRAGASALVVEDPAYEHFVRSASSDPTRPNDCGARAELNGLLCYPYCRESFRGVGPICWKFCPAGYNDDGATCRKDPIIQAKESYGRGAGAAMTCGGNEVQDGALCYPRCRAGFNGVGPMCWQHCNEGYQDDGATCRKDAHIFGKDSYGRGVGHPIWECNNREEQAGLCYDRCREGYRGVGPVCWRFCPAGYTDDGATCRKDVQIYGKASYGRGAGRALNSCGANQELNGALCYPRCRSGFSGVGPVCWKNCATGFRDDGATCRKDGDIFAKESYGRGAGYMRRGDYQGVFKRYIQDHYNMYKAFGSGLSETEKTYLKRWFPARLVDNMKVVELDGMTGTFNFNASATTYGPDLIAVKRGSRSDRLLKHEFVHACQYDRFGIDGFGDMYANQYVDGGYEYQNMEFELDAFDFANTPDSSTTAVRSYTGRDRGNASWYSRCR